MTQPAKLLLWATSLSHSPPHHPLSPYNALLSAHKLLQHADCVLPLDNQALLEIVERAKYGCDLIVWTPTTEFCVCCRLLSPGVCVRV